MPYHLKNGEAGPEAPIHILPADYELLDNGGNTAKVERRISVRVGKTAS
jgi:hypothetical protein